jgi:opacity protein-like surface antigen
MKTKLLLLSSLLFTSLYAAGDSYSPSPSYKSKGFYAKASGGVAFPTVTFNKGDDLARFKPAGLFGAGVGYNFSEAWSADIAATHRYRFKYVDVTGVTQNISSTSVMLSAYYTFPTKTISPYFGGGVGVAFHKVGNIYKLGNSTFTKGRSISSFAYQAGVGIKFKATDNVWLDLGYRYVDSGSFKSSSQNINVSTGQPSNTLATPSTGKMRTNECILSVMYKF